jgi:regulator of nucleoside diphosphate kinase
LLPFWLQFDAIFLSSVIVMPALKFPLMTHLNYAIAQNSPIKSEGFETPIVGAADYLRLRQYVMSDKLADELDRAIVVETEQVPKDVVRMHARCTYIDCRIGTQREIELVYPDESDPAMGKISVLTPVGSALIGLRVGQEIAWEFWFHSERRD